MVEAGASAPEKVSAPRGPSWGEHAAAQEHQSARHKAYVTRYVYFWGWHRGGEIRDTARTVPELKRSSQVFHRLVKPVTYSRVEVPFSWSDWHCDRSAMPSVRGQKPEICARLAPARNRCESQRHARLCIPTCTAYSCVAVALWRSVVGCRGYRGEGGCRCWRAPSWRHVPPV